MCFDSSCVPNTESSFFLFLFFLSLTLPTCIFFCSHQLFCPSLIPLFIPLLFTFFSRYVYIPISPCARTFSNSHMVYTQICISSLLPCLFSTSTYHSGRISQMCNICGMSFSVPFPIGGVMGIQLQDSTYVLDSFLICSYVKSF